MQLTQPGQFPRRQQICRWPLITLCFLSIKHAATQCSRDAHHAIKVVLGDEIAPLQRQIFLILGRHDIGRRAVHTVLIKKQPDNLMPACKHCPGKQQGTPRGGRMRSGKKRNGEFHDQLCQQNMRNDKEFRGWRVGLA
ncbi:Membrane protein insertase Oxa1/YidC/SpoIIIJ [Pseudomonas syringae pv. actinidiae]|uniref:Membrane protein insertase Oxa1/YidC/SpoIIIJ n=1 Tax=Pseudomonas syringae pv. actinidiae TaxID=103796 RepID=A0A2V0QGM5_PSESF|nr:Membrane protein insertase Oxa1/YidC/SpoIIIJ [Pseudomonas syringae pv. actinidiae]